MDQSNLATLLSALASALLIGSICYRSWVDGRAKREARAAAQPYEWPEPAGEPEPREVPRLTLVLAVLAGSTYVTSLVVRFA